MSKQNNQPQNGNHTPEDIELDTYFEAEIEVPKTPDYSFSWRKLWAFTGPGFLMSIAYLDPGNIESDMQTGVVAENKLLWILLYSTVLGLLMQILSARIGVVTGKHLAELCYSRYPKIPRVCLWIMTEIAIIGSDIQEVIGTALALYMLSNRVIPLWAGVLLTVLDTFTFLFLDKYGLRKLESFFGFLVTVMAVTFGYEFFVAKPDPKKIALGLALPMCKDCSGKALLQGVGIVGAIIMPHNLYLHSALVKSRKVDNTNPEETKDANRYILIESSIALFISFLINLAVTSMFATGLHGKSNADVYEICYNYSRSHNEKFLDLDSLKYEATKADDIFDADLYKAGQFLGCHYGYIPFYIWAIGILAAGQSSTMTGTYAGQFVMEGFLNLKWPRWKRTLLTRTIAIAPTLAVTVFSDIDQLTGMNDYLNALMVLQLPFAVLPTLTFSSSKLVMGERFANNYFNLIVATLLSIVVIAINVFFVGSLILESGDKYAPVVYTITAYFGTLYLLFVIYLTGCYLSVLGIHFHEKIPIIGTYYREYNQVEHKYRQ